MEEKIIFRNEIDYVFEGWKLLQVLVSDDANLMEDFKKNLERRVVSQSVQMQKCMAFCEAGLLRAKAHFAGREDEIRTYFAEIEKELTPADFVYLWGDWLAANGEVCTDVDMIRGEYLKLPEDVKDACFLMALSDDIETDEFDRIVGCKERGVLIDEAQRMRNMISYIQSLDFKAESKLKIQDIYLNRERYLEAVYGLLKEAVAFLYEAKEEMEALCVEWERHWRKVTDEGRFLGMLEGLIKWGQESLEKPICIRPSVVQCAGIYIKLYSRVIPYRSNYMTICMLGVIFDDTFNWNTGRGKERKWEEIQPVFKALGDKSKADILLFIKDKPAYGSEIAKQFSLTTATVSHHMNKLLQLGLICADVRDGRVYYQARKDVICELFVQCKKMFES